MTLIIQRLASSAVGLLLPPVNTWARISGGIVLDIEIDISFDAFWSAYPRKTDKAKAKVSFNRLSKANKHNAIAGAKHHAENNPQWRDITLVPHPTTFLNGKRWQDEIIEKKTASDRVQESTGNSPAEIIWKGLVQIYGKAWIDRHGEKPPPVWQSQLRHLEDYQVKRALRKTLDSKSEFMVSLPKLLEFAAKTFGEQHPTRKQLEPPRDNTLALETLAEAKKILGVK